MAKTRKSTGQDRVARSSSTPASMGSERDFKSRPKRKSAQSVSTSKESNKTTSTTSPNFPDLAFRNGILPPNFSTAPVNAKNIQDRINKDRDSPEPSESEYRAFASTIRRAPNKLSVLVRTCMLLKCYDESGYERSFNQAFTSFPKEVGFNNDLSAAQPDMVEGLDMYKFRPFPVREQLGGAAAVYPGSEATTLAHLAGEWKGPGKDMILAQSQAAYDGACMVYGREQARSLLKNADPDGHAFVSTFTIDGTTLTTYAHYSSQSGDEVTYHQFPISSSFLIFSYEDFKKARQTLRNHQDFAKENSERLRDELNKHWSASQQYIGEEDDDPFLQVPTPDGLFSKLKSQGRPRRNSYKR